LYTFYLLYNSQFQGTPISKHSHSSHTPLQKSDKKIGVGKGMFQYLKWFFWIVIFCIIEYQANLDLYVHGQLNGKEHADADECLWHPNYDIPDTAIVDYCKQGFFYRQWFI
jgi:hypothetical protein